MTVHELYTWVAAHELIVLAAIGALPIAITVLAGLIKLVRKEDLSQQVANMGIAIGGMAVFLEMLAIGYVIGVHGVDPLSEASIGLLLAPLYLLVAGFVGEHIVHPGEQKGVRNKIRFGVMSLVFLGLLAAIFSVLRIYMIVFSSIWGFVGFILIILVVFYFIVRKLV